MADKKSVSLINRIPLEIGYVVRGDFLRIKHILINLTSNAIKYGLERDQVILTCRSMSGITPRLEVTDNGPGIALNNQHLLFKPFERIENTQYIEGTGIGLALTKQLMALMHGEAGVISEPGKRSTFWIQLPLS